MCVPFFQNKTKACYVTKRTEISSTAFVYLYFFMKIIFVDYHWFMLQDETRNGTFIGIDSII